MTVNIVLDGAYKGKAVNNVTGKPYIPVSFGKKLYLNKDTVEAYEIITDDTRKSAASGIARGLVGGALLGPVGMLAGGLSAKNKKSVTLVVKFKDGQSSLIEVNDITFKAFVGKMM